ncbi:unnamed protein product [Arabidopsis thaliana]|uniref:Uncharacterized protein n=1 Tax=Arabidopsis thaliana TaxID=3702 RepID=A0A5S9X6X0_ARATH|nr:unnamed protein product [Arabidopsis thaliana]
MDPEEEVLDAAQVAIKKLAKRISISPDLAAAYLVYLHWDDSILTADYLQSDSYEFMKRYFVRYPQLHPAQAKCNACYTDQPCQNVGCGHFICNGCFQDRIVSEIRRGVDNVFCPNWACRKYISHTMLKLHLSEEERVIFASNLVASKKRFTKMEKGRFGNFLDNAKSLVDAAVKSDITPVLALFAYFAICLNGKFARKR